MWWSCVGHEMEAVLETFAKSGLPARFVENADYASGQFSSLLAGLQVVDRPGVVATLVTLVDVPFVSAATVRSGRRPLPSNARAVRPADAGRTAWTSRCSSIVRCSSCCAAPIQQQGPSQSFERTRRRKGMWRSTTMERSPISIRRRNTSGRSESLAAALAWNRRESTPEVKYSLARLVGWRTAAFPIPRTLPQSATSQQRRDLSDLAGVQAFERDTVDLALLGRGLNSYPQLPPLSWRQTRTGGLSAVVAS